MSRLLSDIRYCLIISKHIYDLIFIIDNKTILRTFAKWYALLKPWIGCTISIEWFSSIPFFNLHK